MNQLRVTTGAVWMLWPLMLVGIDVVDLAARHFEYWPRHVPFIGILLLGALCGFYFFCSLPGSRWVLAVAAVVASLYFLFWVLAAGSPSPSGAFEARNVILPLTLLLVTASSVIIAFRA